MAAGLPHSPPDGPTKVDGIVGGIADLKLYQKPMHHVYK